MGASIFLEFEKGQKEKPEESAETDSTSKHDVSRALKSLAFEKKCMGITKLFELNI
jgi:hypothetical protein